MPFKVTDNVSGKIITFQNKPTELDLQEAFGSIETDAPTPPPITTGEADVAGLAREGSLFSGQPNTGFLRTTPETLPEDFARKGYEKARPYIESTLEGGGLAGGGIAGTAAGPMGTVIGGALGYAASKEVIDLLDKHFGGLQEQPLTEELLQSGKDVIEGAALTATGEIGGVALRGAVNLLKKGKGVMPALRAKTVEKRAGEELISQGTDLTATQINQNMKIASELEKKIPRLKLTRGQVTNDAQAISLERSLVRGGIRFKRGRVDVSGADLNQEQKAFTERALQDYYQKQVTGKGSVESFTDIVAAQKHSLESGVKTAQDKVNLEVSKLSRVVDEQELSKDLLNRINPAKKAMKDKATELYNKIPDVKLKSDDLHEGILNLVKSEDGIIEPRAKQMMDLIVKHIRKGDKPVNVGYQVLRKLHSRVGRNFRAANSGANPNLEDARQLGLLRDVVDDAMAQVEKATPQAAQAYRKATQFYSGEYIPKFRQGTIAEVLQKGVRGEETKIAMSNIAGEFFTKDGIDDFIRAVGDDKLAMQSMRDYARFNMFNKTYNPYKESIDTAKAFSWVHRNGKVLEKLGIKKELMDIAKKGHGLNVAQKELDLFNKSVAAKILNSSPERVVEQAFGSSRNYAVTAQDLLKLAKGDKSAEQGIKKAIAEHIIDSSKVTAEGFFTDFKVSVSKLLNTSKRFSSALRVLYKDEPQRIKALMDVRKAYQIAARNIASPIGGGSDTMENISNIIAATGGARAGRYYLIINIKKAISRYSDNQINKYLLKATFDPDYAINLMKLAKNPESEKVITRFTELMTSLTRLGIKQQTAPLTQERPESSQSTLGGPPQNTTPKLLKDLLRGKKQ